MKRLVGCLPATLRPSSVKLWKEMFHMMDFKAVVDVRPLDITIAVACLELGIPMRAVLTNETHKVWWIKQVDNQILRLMGDHTKEAFFQDAEVAKKLETWFGVIETPGVHDPQGDECSDGGGQSESSDSGSSNS